MCPGEEPGRGGLESRLPTHCLGNLHLTHLWNRHYVRNLPLSVWALGVVFGSAESWNTCGLYQVRSWIVPCCWAWMLLLLCSVFLPWWLSQSGVCLPRGRPGFTPWVGKIPWRRKWQPTPVFLPGEAHGQASLMDYSPWGHRDSDRTEWQTLSSGLSVGWNIWANLSPDPCGRSRVRSRFSPENKGYILRLEETPCNLQLIFHPKILPAVLLKLTLGRERFWYLVLHPNDPAFMSRYGY